MSDRRSRDASSLASMAAIITALLVAGRTPALAKGGFTKVNLGDRFPDFAAKDARGEAVSPERFRESCLVIVFVRPDQDLSLRVLRDLQAIYSQAKAARAEIVAVASDRASHPWPAIVKENGLTFPLAIDEGEKVAETAGLVAYPTTAVLSRGSILAGSFLLHDFDFQKVILDEVQGLYQLKEGKLSEREVATRRREEGYDEARRQEEAGNLERALDLYTELEKGEPEPFPVLLARGEILLRLGNARAAAEVFEKARASHPGAAKVLRGLGLARARDGKDREAEPLLLESVQIDPDPGPAHRELSRIYQAAGDLDKALFHAKKAVAAAERRRP